ncbi:MAG TPA: hypothetical protein VKY74_18000, partial [Chloroflexia bacterium]|nr:hypothetical protein [Chloroflexia bacterium]
GSGEHRGWRQHLARRRQRGEDSGGRARPAAGRGGPLAGPSWSSKQITFGVAFIAMVLSDWGR